jgi:nitrogen-specific signal transduction histidine kinase
MITGLATVELRFQDTADGNLTDAMLHGRSIGRGLGLTVDLVTRHEGTIHVEAEPGWSKAIVVSLQRVEAVAEPVAVLAEE